MGLDGYTVCPVYRYNTRLDPTYFRNVGYFRSTQVQPYMEDLGGYGRASESLRREPDYRIGPIASSSLLHADEVWQTLVDIQQVDTQRTDSEANTV